MDITRNWRLKMSRSQLFAVRCVGGDEIVLPQQTSLAARGQTVEVYHFDQGEAVREAAADIDYARAAR